MAVPWDNVLAGVVGGVLGAALRPYAERIVPMPGRMKRVRLAVDRAWTDHQRWVESHQGNMDAELRKIDEDHAARGTFGSGIRLTAIDHVHRRYLRALGDHQRATFRASEDAINELGPIERLWIGLRLRKMNYPDPSIEEKLFKEEAEGGS